MATMGCESALSLLHFADIREKIRHLSTINRQKLSIIVERVVNRLFSNTKQHEI
jgi:hypothetical protein